MNSCGSPTTRPRPREPIQFDPVHVTTDDEIGELARAFERISLTSVQLVGRQVASRRNVAQMFGHVGRRTQNLVGRQIALIDALEAQETDNQRLGDLYRLDHLTSRLRRNASSLVALSGTTDQGAYFAPLALVDVIRLGLGEIEDYTRVDVSAPTRPDDRAGAINDTVLLLAELMENATTFSPPHTCGSRSRPAESGPGHHRRPRHRPVPGADDARRTPGSPSANGSTSHRPRCSACSWSAGWPAGTA